jgi:hypothetical protein
MSRPKIDPSLAEVRQWRESLQKERSHLSLEDQVQEIRRGAERFAKSHGLELKYEETREPATKVR